MPPYGGIKNSSYPSGYGPAWLKQPRFEQWAYIPVAGIKNTMNSRLPR